MTTHVTSAPASASVFQVIETMVSEDIGRIMITDNDVPVGVFTEKDVVNRVVNPGTDARNTAINKVMTTPLRAVREETHIIDALGRMYRGKYRHLLVRGRRGKVVGIVSMRRILNLAVELGQGLKETRTVGDIAAGAIVFVEANSSVQDAIHIMAKKNVTAVVVSTDGRPQGIFTERDVLKRVAVKELSVKATPIKQVMTEPIITMPQTALVGDVLAEMYRRDIRNMPVQADSGNLIGLVSMPEILQYARAFNVDEQVRRSWKEVAELLDTDDQYTPG
jgi:CBS domain-containing protein